VDSQTDMESVSPSSAAPGRRDFEEIWAGETDLPWPPIGYDQAVVLPLIFGTMAKWTKQFKGVQ